MRRLIVLGALVAGVAALRRKRIERSERELGLRDEPGAGSPPIVRA